MPYINKESREMVDKNGVLLNTGQLNYAINKLLNNFLLANGLNYDNLNYILGCLEALKHKIISPGLSQDISKLCASYITNNFNKSMSELTLDTLGVLTAVQFELYRRVASGYEDSKIKTNGDVFDPKLINP